ncbi:TetR/AcrR family transcriptional regulator [Nocardioides panacisoli]|uniref:TetR/AcrR family transcriptional regulator n=1 Tax=Nocardioides panacisoli TaxID=627624 RepID=UPI001C629864|nr:TetR/AcrR family transcriptional regulator [Nocardioides panacisoli]QYJ04152.1 TetR/AcrR family transcriptional regulator [Nocardioides panacisoli]
MRKTPRQARSRRTVERIIAAGREVLLEDGYDAFSTNRVAAAAGVSPGSLYQYFPDKGAILDEVIDRYWEEVTERVAASLADRIGETGPAMVRDAADALLAALEADRPLLRVVAEELPATRHKARRAKLEVRVRELMTAYLAGRPEATHRPEPAVTAWTLVLALENVALHYVLDEPGIDRDRVVAEMVALVGGYLSVPDPPRSAGSS